MGIIILSAVGSILGWLASMVMRTNGQEGVVLNIVAGIVGALLAGVVVTPLTGAAPITGGVVDIKSLFLSFLGAAVLLSTVNFVRRGSVR